MTTDGRPMAVRTVLLTGATSGIGRAASMALAGMGARMVLVGRNKSRLASVVGEISAAGGTADALPADLSSMGEVRALASEFLEKYDRLDVLVNNAGLVIGQRELTADGYEHTFALDHLAPFLLTNLLMGRLKASVPSRVVTVSSTAHRLGRMHFDDIMLERGYGPLKAYAQAKLANVMFTYELSRRLGGTGVSANCLHPGLVRTNFARGIGTRFGAVMGVLRPFMIGPEAGARTTVYLASSPEVEGVTGRYFVRQKEARSSPSSCDKEGQRRLWEISAELTGLGPDRSFRQQGISTSG